jgi:hypothetical protein
VREYRSNDLRPIAPSPEVLAHFSSDIGPSRSARDVVQHVEVSAALTRAGLPPIARVHGIHLGVFGGEGGANGPALRVEFDAVALIRRPDTPKPPRP